MDTALVATMGAWGMGPFPIIQLHLLEVVMLVTLLEEADMITPYTHPRLCS